MPPRDYDLQSQRLGITEEELAAAIAGEKYDRAREYLTNEVSEGHFNAREVVDLARDSLDFLAGIAMPETFEHGFPPVLTAAWQLLGQKVEQRSADPKLALGIPRGHGKTTLVKLFILYCVLYTDVKFILVISSTATLAENIIADVVDMLNHINIIRVYGDWKLGQEKDTQNLKKFGFRGRNIIIAGIGAQGTVRGLNLKNERPDVMVFDDVQTKECSESKLEAEKLDRWMLGTAMKAKSPKGCFFIFCGNMYPGDNSLLKKIKKNPNWIKFISGAILADGTALWPELRPIDSLISELNNDIASGHPEIFFSEVLNDTEAGINNRVDLTGIREWPWSEYDQPQGKCIIIDPASDKATSDDVAIGYCEVFDGKIGLRSVFEEKLSPGNIIRRALLLALKTGTRCIVVESTAFQYSLLYWFNEISSNLNLEGFHFVDIYSGSMSKNSRIGNMTRALTQGELFVHPECKDKVVHQIANWNPLKRNNIDNILDLLTYMQRVLEEYGQLMMTDTNVTVIEAHATGVMEDNHSF